MSPNNKIMDKEVYAELSRACLNEILEKNKDRTLLSSSVSVRAIVLAQGRSEEAELKVLKM